MISADSEGNLASGKTTAETPSTSDQLSINTKLTEPEAKTLLEVSADVKIVDSPIAIGEVVGKYEIRAQLGIGGMGAVYLAFDPLIEREVALKVLSPALGNSSTALQRFLGEARAIGRLNHPHVVSIYDIDRWNGQYFLVMELLAGGSVADRVEQAGPLPWKEACRIVAEAARGLAAAHAEGLVHRDIKPENLMLTKDGLVKVVDFGLSKLLDASHDPQAAVTKAGQILGTPQYMSPEQFEATDVDARTDVYSLGATFYRLLTGRFPFHNCQSIVQVMAAHLTKPPPAATELDTTLPPECDRIIARAMAKKPADRYQTAADLATELQALLSADSASTSSSQQAFVADRPLLNVMIVEPSKLQGAVLKGAFSHAGVRSIQVLANAQAASAAVKAEAPDLLITSMQLPDGRGIELLQNLCRQSLLSQSTVVLNSNDSTVDELIAAGRAACLILSPKKARSEEILRVVHGAGPCIVQNGILAVPVDPAAVRVRIELASGRVPDPLADMIRQLKLLEVDVATGPVAVEASTPLAHLTLVLRREAGENSDFAAIALRSTQPDCMTAVVQIDGEDLILRAVCRNGVVAICQRSLNTRRINCLLQGCRLA